MATLASLILRGHGLRGDALEFALRRHALWFGKTKQQTIEELERRRLSPAPLRRALATD